MKMLIPVMKPRLIDLSLRYQWTLKNFLIIMSHPNPARHAPLKRVAAFPMTNLKTTSGICDNIQGSLPAMETQGANVLRNQSLKRQNIVGDIQSLNGKV